MPDKNFESFVDTVEKNEEAIIRLVELEITIAEQASNQLDEEARSELAISDILPKVDDAVDRLWDWWINRDEDGPEFGASLR